MRQIIITVQCVLNCLKCIRKPAKSILFMFRLLTIELKIYLTRYGIHTIHSFRPTKIFETLFTAIIIEPTYLQEHLRPCGKSPRSNSASMSTGCIRAANQLDF